jgi:hypothetical protein
MQGSLVSRWAVRELEKVHSLSVLLFFCETSVFFACHNTCRLLKLHFSAPETSKLTRRVAKKGPSALSRANGVGMGGERKGLRRGKGRTGLKAAQAVLGAAGARHFWGRGRGRKRENTAFRVSRQHPVKNSKPSPPTSYRSFFVSRHREKMTLGPSTGALTACLFHFFF